MNTAKALMDEVASHGGRLVREGEALRVQAPAPLPADLQARLRDRKADLLAALADEKPDTAQAPAAEPSSTPNGGRTGNVIYATFGRGYRHPDGSIATGEPDPMPKPAMPWPTDLSPLLRKVSIARGWSDAEREQFVQWARRSPEGVADARRLLETEVARLPAPGMADRRREVLAMLAADPDLRVAWTCDDSAEADPVVLTLAVRGAGCCEMAIPRARYDPLALPMLIAKLADAQEAAP